MIEYPPDVVTKADWDHCVPYLEAALRYSHGTHDLIHVYEDIEANRATLWPFERSAVVTQIVTYPKIKLLNFWLAGGNMKDLLSHEPGIVAWGLAQNCRAFTIDGRKGWSRAMSYLGYKPGTWTAYKGAGA